MEDLFTIIYMILSLLVIYFVFVVLRTKQSILMNIPNYIAIAEKVERLNGPQKMDLVISYVRNVVPRTFSIVFSDKVIRQMAQNIFDDMKRYTDEWVKNNIDPMC